MRRVFAPLFAVATLLAATALVDGLATSSARLQVEAQASQVAESTARELEQTLLVHGSAVDGLTAFIESHDRDLASISASFGDFAASSVESARAVKSIQIVRGTRIELVHPLEGNRRAIGLDLFADPHRRQLLSDSVRTGDTMLEGPFDLVQGGRGLAVRRPLFDAAGELWGFAAVIIDWDEMVRANALAETPDGFVIKVVGSDRSVILGAEPADETVSSFVHLGWLPVPWVVEVEPVGGWPESSDLTAVIWSFGVALAILAGLYVRTLVRRPEELQAERLRAIEELTNVERSHRTLFEATPVAIQREDHSRVEQRIAELVAGGVADVRAHLLDHPEQLASILSEVVIRDINPAAEALSRRLGLSDGSRTLADRLNSRSAESLVNSVMSVAEGATVSQHSASDTSIDGDPVELVVRWHAGESDGRPDYSNVYVALQDVTELTVARRRLEATLESQNQFIASISHELRTPLTAVLGFAHELRNESGSHAEADLEEFRGLIEHHAMEMSHIIEDLLVWSRSDIGEVTINFEPFDIAKLVERTLRSLPGTPTRLGASVTNVDVMADPVRVRQILRNLVTNASRYGGDDIFVLIVDADDRVRIEVHDSGPEIPPEKARSIFLPYQRLEAERTMPSSIGLGLAIGRVLSELQDGSLQLERTDTTNAFVLTLRKARRRGRLMPAIDHSSQVALAAR